MKKILCLFSAAVMLLSCCGCSLAQPAPESSAMNGDRLVGVMVTTEYLDLFHMEAWLGDNVDKLTGGATEIGGDTSKYQGRIYAERIEKTSDGSDGATHTLTTWAFPESLDSIMGALFICPTVDENYTSGVVEGCLSDPRTHVRSTDNGDSIELSCTVYFDPYAIPKETITDGATGAALEHICFYTNPVYQTPEGDVYVTSGMGNSYSVEGGMSMDLFSSSSTLSDSVTETVNGNSQTSENKVTVTYQGIRMAQSVTILEMSDRNKLLRSKTYAPADFPTEITVGEDTAYIIAETLSLDSEGQETVSRQICTADHPDESFEVFIPAEGGYAVKQTTKAVRE